MVESLSALLEQVIDYAGLFPPASLELDPAIRAYARHRAEPEAWMLGRFICPAARLAELDPYFDTLLADGDPLTLCVLCRGSAQPATSAVTLDEDLRAAAAFAAPPGTRVSIESFEVKLSPSLTRLDEIRQTLTAAATVRDGCGFGAVPTFWESLSGNDWRDVQSATVGAVASVNDTLAADGHAAFGFKIRCGGVEPSAFPTVEQLACGIVTAARAGVPLKFTAGLHHPLRRYDEGLGCKMHGFLNVFTAAVLASARGLDESSIFDVLACEKISDFAFSPQGLTWQDQHVTTAEIGAARAAATTSFGSCSFDEPREDLQGLGLLP